MKIFFLTFIFSVSIIFFTNATEIDSNFVLQKVDSLILLSDQNYESNDLNGCIEERLNAARLLKSIQSWKKLVTEYNTLNVAYNLIDNIDGAESSLDSALFYSEKYLSQTDIEYLYTLSNLGFREYQLVNFNKCISYYSQALQVHEKLNTSPQIYFNTISNLALAYRRKGDIELSNTLVAYYIRLFFDEYHDDFHSRAQLQLYLSSNYFEDSKFIKTLEVLELARSLTLKVEDELKRKTLFAQLDLLHARTLKFINKPIKALNVISNIELPSTNSINLEFFFFYEKGLIFYAIEEYENAIIYFKLAYEELSIKSITLEKELSNVCGDLASAFLKNEQVDSSFHYAMKSLDHLGIADSNKLSNYSSFVRLANFNINNVRTHCRVANVYVEKFNLEGDTVFNQNAINNYKQAFNGAKFLQKELSSKHSKYILNKNLQEHYPAYFSLLLEIYNEENSQETFQEILQLIEDNKAVVLKEDVQEKLALMSSQIPEELLDKDIEFKEELNTLKRKIHDFKPKNEEDEAVVNNWKEEQLQVTRDYSDHQKYLEDNYPEYFKTKYEIQTINLQDLRDELDGDQAFLSFYQTEENWYCAWVTKESEGIHTVGKPENVKNDLEEVLRILRNNPLDNFQASDRNDFKSSAYNLYGELIPKELETKSSFIISQIGELNYLPFEVLLTSDKTEDLGFSELPYLIKDKEIQYASSAELWLSSKKTKSKNLELAAVSFAPFTEGAATDQRNCVADAKMSALACTKKELDYISDHVTSKSYFSQDASLANFETMDAASIIHLATHACLDDADDAFNKLIFYDDYLSIQDLESMRLNADLAVLSACNTGSGQMKAGEGVIHLGKAFRAAGVSSLITSLWSINDCATADIVGNFYGHLGKENISTALRRAKLDYLKDSNKLLAHPHFWAGLTFSGNAEVLSKDNSLGFLVPIIACLAVILAFFFFRRRN